MYSRTERNRSAFTIIELLVVIGIIGVLLAILLPAMERVRHRGYIQACASNLRSIGQAMSLYAVDNHGDYPRTNYVPGAPVVYGTGGAAINPFGPGGPAPNDITAAIFLLIRTEDLPTATFICPYDDVFVYTADEADPHSRSNFTDFGKNLGYSIANPYPTHAVEEAGYLWTTRLGATFALAADKNPGVRSLTNNDDVTAAVPGAPDSTMAKARSGNHEKDGQNVLYGDGHVTWEQNPLCGTSGDNIYTNKANQIDASPLDKDDSILLPTDDE